MELTGQSSAMDGVLPPGRELHDKNEPIFDQGLAFDLTTLMDRRQVIKLIGSGGVAVGLMTILGCTPGAILSSVSSTGSSPGAGSTTAGTDASCGTIPEETAGPFPGDGSNGPDLLSQSGVVRSDIRSSFGTSTTVAQGIPLTIKLAIQDQANACAPLAGAAAYLWHCDRDGAYSMYSQGVTAENSCAASRLPTATGSLPSRASSGVLLRPLAAHPLRDLPQPRQGHRSGQQDRDIPDRSAERELRPGVRD